MTTLHGPGAAHELRENWRVLAGVMLAFIAGVFTLPYYTAGLFVRPLETDFGWTRTEISLGTSVMMLCFVITSPVIGILTDRYDPRKLVPIGMVASSVGLFALSRTIGALELFLGTIAGLSIIGNLCGMVAIMPILTSNFVKARGTAIGIAMAAIGLGAALGNPVIGYILNGHGWRAGYLAMSIFTLAAMPLVVFLLSAGRKPRFQHEEGAAAALSGMSVREAFSTPAYWIISVAVAIVSVSSSGLVMHFVPMLADMGMPPEQAASQAALIGMCVIGGRLLTGYLLDRMFAPHAAAAIMVVSAAGFVIFLLGGRDYSTLLAIAIGLSFGSEVDLVGYMMGRYFGLRNYGRLFGLSYSLCILGMMASPVLFGWVRDHDGSYFPMMIASVALLILASMLFMLLPSYRPDAGAAGEKQG